MREFFELKFWERRAIIVVLGTAVMTIMGPFGTFETMPFVTRGLFFSAVMIGVGLAVHINIVAALKLHILKGLSRWIRICIGATAAALPGTLVVIFTDAILQPPVMDSSRFVIVFFEVAFVCIAISLVEYGFTPAFPSEFREITDQDHVDSTKSDTENTAQTGLLGTPEQEGGVSRNQASPLVDSDSMTPQPGSIPTAEPEPRDWPFMKRLEPGIGKELISLSMQDHYVEVTSAQGTQMILLRMSDALGELEGYEGLRIHRSHWAATAHMVSLSRKGNKTLLRLSDGRKLPVSATYLDAVKAVVGKA